MESNIDRTRRHLAEAEADVVRLRAELADAEKDVIDLRAQVERHLEHERREEEMRLKREREESVATRILRELREISGTDRFRGPYRMTMSKEEFRRRRAELNDRFRARTEPHRLSFQELSDRHAYLKIFVDEVEAALDRDEEVTVSELEELRKAKAELEGVSAEYFKKTAYNLQPGYEEKKQTSPKRTTSLRTGKKGLGGGLKKRHIEPPSDDDDRQRRIQTLKDDLEYAREKLHNARTAEWMKVWNERIAEMSKELDDLQRGGAINACIACRDPHTNAGRSFCGSECQRTFLLSKMKI